MAELRPLSQYHVSLHLTHGYLPWRNFLIEHREEREVSDVCVDLRWWELFDVGLAELGEVTLQIMRDWAIRYNAAGPNGLKDRNVPGKPPILNEDEWQALPTQVEAGPIPAPHRLVRWRLLELSQWIWDDFGLSTSKYSLCREMRALGFRKDSARPPAPQRPEG